MHTIEYYDDSWDSSCFFVCIDRYYIFVADRTSKSPKWEFIDPRSFRWDAVHQRIYRNGRADKVSKEDLPENFPPPPDSIPPEAINLPPLPKKAPLLAETFPTITKYLGTIRDHSVEVYIVLFENLYESELGDGKFHYPDSIYTEESNAQEYCNKNKTDNNAYHIRKCTIKVDGLTILCELSRQSFDHVNEREVLELLTAKLEEITP